MRKFTHLDFGQGNTLFWQNYRFNGDTVRRQDAANGWGHSGNSGALMVALLLIG